MNRTTLKASFAALAVAAMSATSASAATIDFSFNLTGNNTGLENYADLPKSVTLTDGDLEAVFDGRTFNSNGSVANSGVGLYYGGAGVKNSVNDSHTIDSWWRSDFLQITFDKTVTVTELVFGYVDRTDEFRVFTDTDNNGIINALDSVTSDTDIPNNNTFSVSGLEDITVFGVGATAAIRTGHWYQDNWKLLEVNGTYEIAPVPLPASGLLLVAGLGGMVAMRRRKKTA